VQKDVAVGIDAHYRARVVGHDVVQAVSGDEARKILEADQALGDAICEALSGNGGYDVATATSAIEAGATLFENKPDVFIVDVTLPDVLPRAIVRWVRSTEELRDTCLVGIAPGMTDAKGQALIQDGFDAYLSKPFDASTLIGLIEERRSSVSRQGAR